MAHHIARLIFDAIQKAAEKNKGVVTIEQIKRLQRIFDDSGTQLASAYEDHFNACMDLVGETANRVFRRQHLLQACLMPRIREALAKSAVCSPDAAGEQCAALVCQTVAERVAACAGSAAEQSLSEVYYRLASTKGRDLRASDLIEDTQAKAIVSDLLADVRTYHETNPDFAAGLRELFNWTMSAASAGGPPAYAVSKQQMDALLSALLVPAPAKDTAAA